MLSRMFFRLAVVVFVTAACAPTAATPPSTPTASPTATSTTAPITASPSATASSSPSRTSVALPNSAQVAAAGNGVVWMYVADSRLFRSTDKGETWTERALPPNTGAIGRIAFTSDRDGWILALAAVVAPSCQQQQFALWHTSDGASTWQTLNVTGLDSAECKGPASFVDADRGYIPIFNDTTGPRIARSADGGKTWTLSSRLSDAPGFTSRAGSTLRPDVVADFGDTLLSDVFAVNAGTGPYAFRSTDRGTTWSYATTAQAVGIPIVFITATRWLQVISPGDSQETTDGGRSWHKFGTDYSQAAPIPAQIAFGDANTGYATVRGGLMRTVDGGAHWTALKTPGT